MRIIPHSKPTLDLLDAKAVADVVSSGFIAQGKRVEHFEQACARYVGVRFGVAVNSGTSALHLALLGLKIKPNDQVMIPSYACSALLNPIFYVGAQPNIVDVDEDTWNISLDDARRKMNKKVKAIIVPHAFGLPADIKGLLSLGVSIIEDCAQSLGAHLMGKTVGSLGSVAVASFYATKMMTTAEGGMVLTNSRQISDLARDLRAYDEVGTYKVRYNYKMSDMAASLGLSQLKKLPLMIKARQSIAHYFSQQLSTTGMILPITPQGYEHVFFRYVARISRGLTALLEELNKNGINARRPIFKPLHHYIKSKPCLVSDHAHKTCLSLPIYPSLSNKDMGQIIQQVIKAKKSG